MHASLVLKQFKVLIKTSLQILIDKTTKPGYDSLEN